MRAMFVEGGKGRLRLMGCLDLLNVLACCCCCCCCCPRHISLCKKHFGTEAIDDASKRFISCVNRLDLERPRADIRNSAPGRGHVRLGSRGSLLISCPAVYARDEGHREREREGEEQACDQGCRQSSRNVSECVSVSMTRYAGQVRECGQATNHACIRHSIAILQYAIPQTPPAASRPRGDGIRCV